VFGPLSVPRLLGWLVGLEVRESLEARASTWCCHQRQRCKVQWIPVGVAGSDVGGSCLKLVGL
jgi:hypothetical protein